jgi:hypothetical protein
VALLFPPQFQGSGKRQFLKVLLPVIAAAELAAGAELAGDLAGQLR